MEERWVCGSGDKPQHRQLKQQYKECSFKIKWDARSGSVVVVASAVVGKISVRAPHRYFFGTCFCCYSLFLRPERNVDEALHAQMLNTLSKVLSNDNAGRALVLLIGDGNCNINFCSFPNCVQSALRKGWRGSLVMAK